MNNEWIGDDRDERLEELIIDDNFFEEMDRLMQINEQYFVTKNKPSKVEMYQGMEKWFKKLKYELIVEPKALIFIANSLPRFNLGKGR